MFDGNVRSAVQAPCVLPAMREARFGRIVLFGMNGSSETRPHRGLRCTRRRRAVTAFARGLPSKKRVTALRSTSSSRRHPRKVADARRARARRT